MNKNRKKIDANNPQKRLGVIGIFIYNLEKSREVNEVLSKFYLNIKGRMGLPLKDGSRNLAVISIIFEGTTDELGALTGRLGKIEGVSCKSFLAKTGGNF